MIAHSLHALLEGLVDYAGLLQPAALSMERGGVGFYPSSDFVHVDTGRVRRWSGV